MTHYDSLPAKTAHILAAAELAHENIIKSIQLLPSLNKDELALLEAARSLLRAKITEVISAENARWMEASNEKEN